MSTTALTPASGASKRAGPGSATSASAGAVAVSYAHADIGLAPNNWLQQRLQAAEVEQQRKQRKVDARLDKIIRSKVVDLGVPAMRTSAAAAAAAAEQSPSLSVAAAATPALASDFPDLFAGGAALLASLTGPVVASTHRSSICSSMNQKSSKVMISHTRVKIKDAKSNKEAVAATAAATAAASAQVAVAPVIAASAPAAASAFGSSFTTARFSTARSTNRVAASTAAGSRAAHLPSSTAANVATKAVVLPAPVAGSGGRKRSSDALTATAPAAALASPAVRGSGGSAKKRKLGDAPVASATPLRHSARLTLGSPGLGSLLTTPQAEKEIRIEETPMQTGGSGATSGHGRTPHTGATKGAGGPAQPVGFRVRKKLFGSPDQTARPPAISAGSATSFSLRLSPAANAAAAATTASTPSPGSSHRSLFVGATPSPASSRRTPGSSRSMQRDLSPTIAASVAKVHPASPSVSPTVATRLGKHHSIKRPLKFDETAPDDTAQLAAEPELPVGKKARRGEKASAVPPAPIAFGSFAIRSSVVLSASSAAPHRALSIVPEAAPQQEHEEDAAAEEEAEAEEEQPRKPASQRKFKRKNTSTAAAAASVPTPRETRSQRAR